MKTFYFIDYENIQKLADNRIPKLSKNDTVFLPYTKQNKRDEQVELLEYITNMISEVNLITDNVAKKNQAVDTRIIFDLTFLITQNSRNNPDERFRYLVISKDRGYDMYIRLLAEAYPDQIIKRETDIIPDIPDNQITRTLIAHKIGHKEIRKIIDYITETKQQLLELSIKDGCQYMCNIKQCLYVYLTQTYKENNKGRNLYHLLKEKNLIDVIKEDMERFYEKAYRKNNK